MKLYYMVRFWHLQLTFHRLGLCCSQWHLRRLPNISCNTTSLLGGSPLQELSSREFKSPLMRPFLAQSSWPTTILYCLSSWLWVPSTVGNCALGSLTTALLTRRGPDWFSPVATCSPSPRLPFPQPQHHLLVSLAREVNCKTLRKVDELWFLVFCDWRNKTSWGVWNRNRRVISMLEIRACRKGRPLGREGGEAGRKRESFVSLSLCVLFQQDQHSQALGFTQALSQGLCSRYA